MKISATCYRSFSRVTPRNLFTTYAERTIAARALNTIKLPYHGIKRWICKKMETKKRKENDGLIIARRNGFFAPSRGHEQEKLIFILIVRSYGYIFLGPINFIKPAR